MNRSIDNYYELLQNQNYPLILVSALHEHISKAVQTLALIMQNDNIYGQKKESATVERKKKSLKIPGILYAAWVITEKKGKHLR